LILIYRRLIDCHGNAAGTSGGVVLLVPSTCARMVSFVPLAFENGSVFTRMASFLPSRLPHGRAITENACDNYETGISIALHGVVARFPLK